MKKTIKLIALALVLTLSVVMLASCFGPNADPEKAAAKLKENGYIVSHDESGLSAFFGGFDVKDVTDVVSASAMMGTNYEHVTIIYFEDTEAANDAWEDVKEKAEKDDKKEDEDWVIKKFGSMIYYGTKAAIDAAK